MTVRAYFDGTHEQLLETELAQIMREHAYERAVERIKQRRSEAKQQTKRGALCWDQLEWLDCYERRALSPRETAANLLDEAKAATSQHRDNRPVDVNTT